MYLSGNQSVFFWMSAWSVYIYTFSFLLIKKSEEIKQQQQQLLPIHTYSFLFFFLSFFFGFFSVFFRWVSKVWQRAKKEEKEKSTNLLFYFTPRFLSLSFSPFLLFSLSLTRFPESHILHIHFSLSTGWMTAWFFLHTSTSILYIYSISLQQQRMLLSNQRKLNNTKRKLFIQTRSFRLNSSIKFPLTLAW